MKTATLPIVRLSAPIRRAFTLLEVMFAILILGVGLVAVAGLFPIAGAMQKETVDQVMVMNIASTADALLQERGISKAALNTIHTALAPGTNVFFATDTHLGTLGLPLADRSYPTTVTPAASRTYCWRPMFRKDTAGNWYVYIFIQRRLDASVVEPRPVSVTTTATANTVYAGDIVLDANGTIRKVIFDVLPPTATHADLVAWHGIPVGGRTSTLNIVQIGNGAVR